MSEYIITAELLAIIAAKCGVNLVDADGKPICDPGEIIEVIGEPIKLREIVHCGDCTFRNPNASVAIWEEDGKVVRGFPEKSAYLCSLINRCVELSGFCKWGMVREDG